MTAGRTIDGKDAVSRARRQRHEGVGDLPGHHDVRRAHRRGAKRSASSTTPLDNGVNFIDTANVYTEGRSEAVIGPAIKAKRDRWVLATKVAQSTGPNITDRGLSRRHLMQAVDASLKRLQTDHIDLYYIHRVDPDTAWEETIAAFGDLIRQGKIRAWALSNVKSWHIPHVHHLCRQLGVPQPAALQPYYNLMNRQPEVELLPAAKAFGLGVVPYSPLARGVLTGKYKVNQKADPASRAGRQDRRMLEFGVAPREPDDRREAEGARREARHHAGGLGVGLGAQQPRHQLHHRRPAHLRAVGELLRGARLQVDARRTRSSPTAWSCRATPRRRGSTIRRIRWRGGSRRWGEWARRHDLRMPSSPRRRGPMQACRTCSARWRGCPPARA